MVVSTGSTTGSVIELVEMPLGHVAGSGVRGRRCVGQAREIAELPSDEREALGPTPVLNLFLPGERMVDVVVLLVPDQLHRQAMPGVVRTKADAVFAHSAFEVGRAADVERSVGAEEHVCASHALIMSGTTDSFRSSSFSRRRTSGSRVCRDRVCLEVELVETSVVEAVVSTGSTTEGAGSSSSRLRVRPEVELVETS